MMKRKFLAVILPIVGCATLVGSGFSAWVFSEQNASKKYDDFGTTIDVTEKVVTGDSTLSINLAERGTIKDGTYLVLDQGGANTDDSNYNNKGIMFSDTKIADVVANDIDLIVNASYDNQNLALNRLAENGMFIEINVTISLSKILLNYVNVDTNDEFKVTDGVSLNATTTRSLPADSSDGAFTEYKYSYKPILTDDTSTVKTWTLTLDLATDDDLINSYLTYKSRTQDDTGAYTGGKPTTPSEYDTMSGLLDNKGSGTHFKVEYEIKLGYVQSENQGN